MHKHQFDIQIKISLPSQLLLCPVASARSPLRQEVIDGALQRLSRRHHLQHLRETGGHHLLCKRVRAAHVLEALASAIRIELQALRALPGIRTQVAAATVSGR